jgi:hypothetical protein
VESFFFLFPGSVLATFYVSKRRFHVRLKGGKKMRDRRFFSWRASRAVGRRTEGRGKEKHSRVCKVSLVIGQSSSSTEGSKKVDYSTL